ncbi:alpha-amylase family glycosyl hydrolase [Segetibacter koreensis]|uniref:alpha-amylase family glycosyl hydrolase n=1 Tax=Segetibacter koreensis TaxID=398037 RepID=UPI000366059B|nr:alpha-amylase family glycosyl hydrolase [Segetibacter koreensis]
MKKVFLLLVAIGSYVWIFGQSAEVYPTHWWAGMKNPSVQLMIHSPDIGEGSGDVTINYPGVTLRKVHKVESKNYLFADLNISQQAKPGSFKITIKTSGKPLVVNYELKKRREGNGIKFAQGVTSSDFIYLLMPDRFSNGDESNDRIPLMRDQSLNRDSIYLRHGGDMKGVINHLDYLQNLGVTTLWMTPVLENDMPNRTEHGYAFTNHYKIDPRLGGEEAYKALSDSLHKRGMKLIQDAVYNHVGIKHFTVIDPPLRDWLHQWPTFTKPNYKDQTLFDPYFAKRDRKQQVDGWFTDEMPDLNQSNPYVANFLIQHAIYCVEEFGVDGWRIDTYIYCDLDFMNRCNQALADEYPKITEFGEVWVDGTVNEAYFTKNNINTSFKSNLIGVTDFQTLFHGIQPALKEKNGVSNLYQTLSNDILYKNPMNNVIFLDNHDMTRFFSQVGESADKQKIGIQWLLTSRGIPQMYYGTEILMRGFSYPYDGNVRLDFPGGWKNDKISVFTGEGLQTDQQEVLSITKSLANFRKTSSAIKTGKMTQYVPDDGLYVYFRYDNNQTIMCIMNTNNEEKQIDFSRYDERTKGFNMARSVTGKRTYQMNANTSIPGNSMWVLELNK